MELRTSLVVAVAVLAFSTHARAADRFAMSCLENKTNLTVNYSVKWGSNGTWKGNHLAPGARNSHTWEYAQGKVGVSPQLYVRFDDDLSGRVKQREYVLESYRAPQKTDCKGYGKEYVFRYDGSAKKFIDLKAVKG